MHHFSHLLMPYSEIFADWVPNQKIQVMKLSITELFFVYDSQKIPCFWVYKVFLHLFQLWSRLERNMERLVHIFQAQRRQSSEYQCCDKIWLFLLEMWDPKLLMMHEDVVRKSGNIVFYFISNLLYNKKEVEEFSHNLNN